MATVSSTASRNYPINVQVTQNYTYDNYDIDEFKNAACGLGFVSGSAQITVRPLTVTPTTLSNGNLCPGRDAVSVSFGLNGTPPSGTTYSVQLSDRNGSFQDPLLLATGTSSPINCPAAPMASLGAGSGYRIRVIPTNNTNAVQASATTVGLTLTRTPDPAAPDITYCEGSPQPLQVSGSNLFWYGISTNDGPYAGYNRAATPDSPTTPGVYRYQVSQTVGNCQSSYATMKVTVKPKSRPVLANQINQNQTFCRGQNADPISFTDGPNLNWYDSNRNLIGTDAPRPNTGNAGQQTFFVSRDDTGCRSDLTEIKVTVNDLPPAPQASGANPICQYKDVPTLSANGQNLRWYRQETGGTAENQIKPLSTQAGTTSFWVSQIVNNCEGPRTKIEQRINEASPDPVTQTVPLCQRENASQLTATGQGLRWYDGGGTFISTDAPRPPTDQVRDITYKVSQTSNGCESRLVDLLVQVRETPGAPGVADIPVCNNATAPVLSAQGNQIRWYAAETGGTATENPPGVSTAQVGEQAFWVTQQFGSCIGPRAKLTVRVIALPPAPVPNAPGPICETKDVPTLSASGDMLRWYRQATGGTSEGPIKPSSGQAGTTSFWVSQVVNNCEGPRAKLDQVIHPVSPLPTIATLPVLLCRGQDPTSLTANGQNLRWYDGGAALGTTAPQPPTGQVRDLLYKVSQTSNSFNCESRLVDIPVRVRERPGAPGVIPVSLCQNQPALPLTAAGDGLTWYEQETGGTSSLTLTPQTAILGERTYWVTQRFGECEGPRAALRTTVQAVPAMPAATGKDYCIGDASVALTATGDALRWYTNADRSGGSQGSILPPTDKSQNLTYYVTQTRNGCESAPTSVLVRVRARAIATLSGDNKVIAFDSTAIRIRLEGDSPWSFTLWNGQPVTTSNTPYVVWEKPNPAAASATYALRALRNDCGAGNTGNTYVLIIEQPLATEPLLTVQTDLRVYPIPASHEVTAEWVAPAGTPVTLQLMNVLGQVSWQGQRQGNGLRQTERLDLSQQPGGLLIVTLLLDNHPPKSVTLLKQ